MRQRTLLDLRVGDSITSRNGIVVTKIAETDGRHGFRTDAFDDDLWYIGRSWVITTYDPDHDQWSVNGNPRKWGATCFFAHIAKVLQEPRKSSGI
jgi:hypothetical protein